MPNWISERVSRLAPGPSYKGAVQDPAAIKQDILARARTEGFDVARFTDARAQDQSAVRLRQFLDDNHHGTMAWMAERAHWRADPNGMWPQARSIILLGLNYGPSQDPLDILRHKELGAISVYAQGDDYHDVMKKKLKALAGYVFQTFQAEVKVFVDTAPVMEKPLAHKAGLGWQGKHTNLVSREFGSWLFLGSIFTTLELPADAPESDHCGNCHACLDVCPTDAFPAPYRLDARRCISYLTIEHDGPIPRQFRKPMGNRIYGCDDCLAVCPWNKFAKAASDMKLTAREELKGPALSKLAALDDSAFRALFRKSPVKRIGRDRFLRNVMIAIGNSGEAALVEPAKAGLQDDSAQVRGAAVWALSQLVTDETFTALARLHAGSEPDPQVRDEWIKD